MSDKRAIVIGHRGQDGRLLCDLLLSRGYSVTGLGRDGVEAFPPAAFSGAHCSLHDSQAVEQLVDEVRPDEIYYLAAHHRSSEASYPAPADDWKLSYAVNAAGVLHFLEAVRKHVPSCRLFYASSSLIYGVRPLATPQTELTPPSPCDPYGATKLLGSEMCGHYRARHGVFATVGILYNHESDLRRDDFLSKKLALAALAAHRGESVTLSVGKLDAAVDWGYAPDFVDAFTRILALPEPEDFVIATGMLYTVRDFAEKVFGHVGLDWRDYIREDASLLTRSTVPRVGDASKLRALTGWAPSLPFEQMVQAIVDRLLEPSGESPRRLDGDHP